MTFATSLRREWLSNPRADVLAGIVVALALIPEALGFSIIAGVDPSVGLFGPFSIAVLISQIGRAPCRERVCPYVKHSGVAVPFKNKTISIEQTYYITFVCNKYDVS